MHGRELIRVTHRSWQTHIDKTHDAYNGLSIGLKEHVMDGCLDMAASREISFPICCTMQTRREGDGADPTCQTLKYVSL